MRQAIEPIDRQQARELLKAAGMPKQQLPAIGYLVPLDTDMNSWIENCGGQLQLITFSLLAKPAWLSPVILTKDVGAYLRREKGE